MTVQSRETKVLVALLVSIISGAVILNSLGYNPPSAGAFCLSRYYRLAPVEKAVVCEEPLDRGRWRRIEIFCSRGNVAEPAKAILSANAEPASEGNCHFIIHNGRIEQDGQIEPTRYWKKQWSVNPHADKDIQPALADVLTIFVCLATGSQTDHATDFQIKRAEALVEELCRRFNIWPESVHYPDTWR